MLEDFNFDLRTILQIFYGLKLDVEFITTTDNGWEHSIIDAIVPVREFLKRNNLHDYEKQVPGPKKYLPTFFVTEYELTETETSLYRPETKKGVFRRIWFLDYKNYGNPRDLLALVTDGESIYVIDLSLESVRSSLLSGGYVYNVLKELSKKEQAISKELLSNLYRKKALEWISDSFSIEEEFESEKELSPQDFIQKLDSKYANSPQFEKKVVNAINRPSVISNKIKELYGSKCMICGYSGFEKKNGGKYAEVHHMIELNKQAPKTLQSWNVIVVCPTCHRKLHYGKVDSEFLNPGWKININGNEIILRD
jgi:hypothetical protein